MSGETLCRFPASGTLWDLTPSAEAVDLQRRGNFVDDDKYDPTPEIKCGDCETNTFKEPFSATAVPCRTIDGRAASVSYSVPSGRN